MIRTIILRILQIIPTLIIISWILFFMSQNTPSDPVVKLMDLNNSDEQTLGLDLYQRKYLQLASSLGLDKPSFYFAIVPQSYPDTLWQINHFDRENYRQLIHQYPDPIVVGAYKQAYSKLARDLDPILKGLPARDKVVAFQLMKDLGTHTELDQLKHTINNLENLLQDTVSSSLLNNFDQQINKLETVTKSFNFWPRIKWFGKDNQYHHWISKIIRFDFGISIRDGRPVTKKIKEAIFWTFSLNGTALVISFILSIALGVFLGAYASPFWDRLISSITFGFYAIPIFWLATLGIVFFTTPEYGRWTDWFPGIGVVPSFQSGSVGSRFFLSLSRLLLPLICMIISMMAYLTRQMRRSLRNELHQPYIDMLRIKGIPKKTRVFKHALPNALFPMITLFGSLIPFVFAGSLVIEYIFNIPGMGFLLMNSILFEDWNVVFSIVFMISIFTMLGLLLADLFYAWLDPRVNLDQ